MSETIDPLHAIIDAHTARLTPSAARIVVTLLAAAGDRWPAQLWQYAMGRVAVRCPRDAQPRDDATRSAIVRLYAARSTPHETAADSLAEARAYLAGRGLASASREGMDRFEALELDLGQAVHARARQRAAVQAEAQRLLGDVSSQLDEYLRRRRAP